MWLKKSLTLLGCPPQWVMSNVQRRLKNIEKKLYNVPGTRRGGQAKYEVGISISP